MKQILSKYFLFIVFVLLLGNVHLIGQENASQINWMSWEEAVVANETTPKKFFIDVYTDWCGWCKKMDASTFKDPELVGYMNEHFYAIKFNAEQKEDVVWNDFTYKFINGGRRGYHQFAQTLLDGRLGYPSFVLLDEETTRIMLSPGFKTADKIMLELKYAKEEEYKKQSFSKFKSAQSED